jgi:hypothetical protein
VFDSRREHGCPSLVSVVCCQVEVSVSGWSLVQRSPTVCGVSEYDREASTMRSPWPTGGCCAIVKKILSLTRERKIVRGLMCCIACRDRRKMTQDFSHHIQVPVSRYQQRTIRMPNTSDIHYIDAVGYSGISHYSYAEI